MEKVLSLPPLTTGTATYQITAYPTWCGKDLAVIVGGGTRPHIGAVALATPRPSLKQNDTVSASASVLCSLGHKDDLPARELALLLAALLNTTVTVTAGIHLDEAKPEDLEILHQNWQKLTKLLQEKLSSQKL